jgi:hypothetical protein
MATRAKLLLLQYVQDDPAVMMATHAKHKLQQIVECLFLLCDEDNSETMTSSQLLFCIKDALAITTANFLFQLIVDTPNLLLSFNEDNPAIMTATHTHNICFILLHEKDNSEKNDFKFLAHLHQRRPSNYDGASLLPTSHFSR